jgi:hypothetical protein
LARLDLQITALEVQRSRGGARTRGAAHLELDRGTAGHSHRLTSGGEAVMQVRLLGQECYSPRQCYSPVHSHRFTSGGEAVMQTPVPSAKCCSTLSSLVRLSILLILPVVSWTPVGARSLGPDVAALDRDRVRRAADQYLKEAPITITASTSPRSAGGRHDFFSEGDYWWPDPQNPGGPYIQRDGLSNPRNFVDHRHYLMRLSVQVPALVAAWRLTKNRRYSEHAVQHLRAWFIDPRTRMNPNLQYAQAIQGRFTGRGIGIIDTIHLVEVARAIEVLERFQAISRNDLDEIKRWFSDYLRWMTTHKYGKDERDAKNNHGTCWVMQVGQFARLTGNQRLMTFCRERFKTVLIPEQMAADGSFPQELRRTKPYGYSLFNLDALAAVCQILSTPEDNLWNYSLEDGRGMRKAMEYMYPYIKEKKLWPLARDVMYDDEWPMRQSSLLFAGLAYGRADYLNLWKTLRADSTVEEVIRNFFIRQPVLWVN